MRRYLWILVVCFIISSIYGAYTFIEKAKYFEEKYKHVGYLGAEIYKTNSSSGIITLKIVEGHQCTPDEIKWILECEQRNEETDLSATEKNRGNFTDERLSNDTEYQIYWYDTDGDDSMDVGDYLKLKLPERGEYILHGNIKLGKTRSGETIYVSIIEKKLSY